MATKKGYYRPKNPKKYKGDYKNIIFRSSWEEKFMKYCDTKQYILEWGSEEYIIPYRDPTSGKVRRYFPDFYIKVKESSGKIKKYIIEIKPARQTKEPKIQKKKTRGYIYEVYTYAKNQAKWEAAKNFCDDRLWEFKILTERELGISN
tara:strand:+ start:2115 stop:2558 length:444 start_codon:yes stop_codon:yes gene_type:complete